MGYVDTGVQGWTELRVHGVSGTAAPALLDHPNVTRVAGNAAAGFYRRTWESRASADDGGPDGESPDDGTTGTGHRVEAYSWGGLTSGDWTRALWLLLLPFMLMNVAFYMTPASPLDESSGWRKIRAASESVQRILALTLTVTFTLAAVTAVMDLVGWQCARTGTDCATGPWLAFYQWNWMQQGGRRLAVAAIVPIAIIALLWRLGQRTWTVAESVAPPAAPAQGIASWQSPLEDRAFWNGRGPVARLRSLHIGTAYAVIGVFLAAPLLGPAALGSGRGPLVLLDGATWTAPGTAVVASLVLAFVAIVVTSFVWVALPSLGRRERPTSTTAADRTGDGPGGDIVNNQQIVAGVAVALLVLTWVLAYAAQDLLGTPSLTRAASGLPWLASATIGTFAVQLGLLVVLGGLCLVQSRWHPGRRITVTDPEVAVPGATVVSSHVAWRGLGTVVFAGIGWALAGGMAAAVTVRLADVLGTPQPPPTPSAPAVEAGARTILLPVEYFWAGATAVPILVALVIAAGAVLLRERSVARALTARVVSSYAGTVPGDVLAADAPRTRTIAAIWARATITERLRKVMATLALVVTVVLLAAVVGDLAHPQWVMTRAVLRFLIPAGGLVMTGFVLGLLWVGRQAYRDARFRRSVGILWDLGTFWPRATHPLAPPCYAERTVPDLLNRIEHLRTGGGRVVLSCHSQGSAIGAAVLSAMTYQCLDGTAFLTYGSPLRRLYARFFPAYFGLDQLARIGDLLWRGPDAGTPLPAAGPDAGPDGTGPDAVALPAGGRPHWPWINLHRRSDPIGGPIFVSNPPFTVGRSSPAADLDWQLLDPVYTRPPGDSVDAEPLGHSGYPLDPAFALARHEVRRRRDAAAPDAVPAPARPAPSGPEPAGLPSPA